jgi:hypothetical protein
VIADFQGSCLVFHISCVSALRFAHLNLSHWLEVLIIKNLSVELLCMFWQDWVVARLVCHFSPLAWYNLWYNTTKTNSPIEYQPRYLHEVKKIGNIIYITNHIIYEMD